MTRASPDPLDELQDWTVDRLVDHVVSTCHAYERATMPRIAHDLDALAAECGKAYPDLGLAAAAFARFRDDLEHHLVKEEHLLFPYIRELATTPGGARRAQSPFGTVENPIRMMEREHRDLIAAASTIRALIAGGGRRDHAAALSADLALARFEQDLRRHVEIEDRLVFPKAIELETAC